jgi:hypothetical protein
MNDWQNRITSASLRPRGSKSEPPLPAADGHACEGVLEDLLEAEELHNAQVNRRVETQATLVGAEGRVEFNPEAPVDLNAAGVVGPRHAEDDLAFGHAEPLQDGGFDQLRVTVVDGAKALENLGNRLVEFGLAGVPRQYRIPDGFKPRVHTVSSNSLNIQHNKMSTIALAELSAAAAIRPPYARHERYARHTPRRTATEHLSGGQRPWHTSLSTSRQVTGAFSRPRAARGSRHARASH